MMAQFIGNQCQRYPIVDFLDIETDGKALYLSGTSKQKDGYGLPVAQNTHSFKYDLDGNQVWYSNSKHYGQKSEEYGSTIFENQLISAGKTHKKRSTASGSLLVSRDLETGDVSVEKNIERLGIKVRRYRYL